MSTRTKNFAFCKNLKAARGAAFGRFWAFSSGGLCGCDICEKVIDFSQITKIEELFGVKRGKRRKIHEESEKGSVPGAGTGHGSQPDDRCLRRGRK